jgi:uncharacterized protein (TIGR03083 family)
MERDVRSLLEGLETTHRQVGSMLADLAPDAWDAAVPATPAWVVGDVVSHLAEGERAALASATSQQLPGMAASAAGAAATLEEWTAAHVAVHAGEAPAARLHAWEAASDAWRWHLAAVEGDGWRQRVPWVLGEVTLRTLAQLRLNETWLHGHDIAEAVGAGFEIDQATLSWLSDLAARVIPGGLSRRGRPHPGAAILVRLDGADEWLVAGAVGERPQPGGAPDLVLEADPLTFVLRAAGRTSGEPWRASGDRDLAADIAATLNTVG